MGTSDGGDGDSAVAGAAHRMALREREALMGEAEAIARVGSYLWEPGQPPVWSDGMFRILGYAPGAIEPGGEAFFSRVHPDDLERIKRAQAAAVAGEMPDVEYRILRADTGELRYLRGVSRVHRDPERGLALRIVGALLDITDARLSALRDEQTLVTQRAAERLGKFGTYVVRTEPMEIVWSEGLRELTGLHDPNAGAQQRFELIHPDDREPYMRWWGELMANKTARPITTRMYRPDGELIHTTAHAAVLRFEADGVERVVGTVVDVTERVLLEEQLRHAAKMEAVGALAAGVAHDFNNYLMVISGSLELLAQQAPSTAAAQRDDLMEHARHAVTRCMDLTQQLLAFGRRKPSRSEVVDLQPAVERIGALLQPTLGRSVRLQVEPSEPSVRARIDPSHLEQLLANLAINARDAIAERGHGAGRIVVRVELVRLSTPLPLVPVEVPAGRWARIEVSDDGCGVAPEHLSRIFDPYFTTKALGRGTGLGLSSVYGTALQHGGHVTVHSEAGQGTTFSVWLPAVRSEPPTDPPELPKSRPPPRTPCVLLVDDLPEVRHVAALALRTAGFEVVEASDGVEALAQLAGREVELVLSDVRMPRMDGVELARTLAERWPALPVLLMSGYTELPQGARALSVLDKPLAPERLVAEVRRRLQGG